MPSGKRVVLLEFEADARPAPDALAPQILVIDPIHPGTEASLYSVLSVFRQAPDPYGWTLGSRVCAKRRPARPS